MEYTIEEVLNEFDEIDFDEESHARGPVLEAALYSWFELPNIGRDESALKAAIEYAFDRFLRLDLEEIEGFVKRFVQFFMDWGAAAEETLWSLHGEEFVSYLPHMDLERLGRDLKDDEGLFEVSDGRIAQFDKEGQ